MTASVYLNGVHFAHLANGSTLTSVKKLILEETNLEENEFNIFHNGKPLKDENEEIHSNVRVILRIIGGKGGFGSMLRAIGAQIEKTTNREACRDLSGRRLRDINEEKRLKAWLDKQKDREAEAEEKRKKKLEKLTAIPKHEFKDADYENARSELTEKVSDAVEEGFKKATALKLPHPLAIKRKATGISNVAAKKPALWIADDLGSSDSDSDTDTDSESNNNDNETKNGKTTPSSSDTEKSGDDSEAGSSTSDKSAQSKTESVVEK